MVAQVHRNNENFRVFVFMPPVPAFEGELGERSGIQVQAMLFHAYASINRSKQSLLTNLEREVGDTSKYIQFYALRTFAELGGKL
uniref:Uncharacterized protein n=1 Tax=Romanomermis culicivorax TaxID=13658 RepID=A0A915IXK4_ROMCU